MYPRSHATKAPQNGNLKARAAGAQCSTQQGCISMVAAFHTQPVDTGSPLAAVYLLFVLIIEQKLGWKVESLEINEISSG
jgi:hypothetical protein